MPSPAILIVTGASGAGKTASVRALDALALPGVACFHFDSIGVPSPEEMERQFGGGEAWQSAATERWAERLVAEAGKDVVVLDGQSRPSVVRAALRRAGATRMQIVLLDCSAGERARRLTGPRGQPDLATTRMDNWAAYLRGQADALGLPVIDTTELDVREVTAALAHEVERLRAPGASSARVGE
jgi:RNase adaptor protein for sRNA GlmZ degradation